MGSESRKTSYSPSGSIKVESSFSRPATNIHMIGRNANSQSDYDEQQRYKTAENINNGIVKKIDFQKGLMYGKQLNKFKRS